MRCEQRHRYYMSRLTFVLCGGDSRFEHLARLLRREGHGVRLYALGGSELSAEEAARGADYGILPLPAAKGAMLNAAEGEGCTFARVMSALSGCRAVLGGQIGSRERMAAEEVGARLIDYYQNESLLLENAALTAEGAVSIVIRMSERALLGSRALVIGYGRIGSALAERLRPFGQTVTVAARSGEKRTLARCRGFAAVAAADMDEALREADFVFNTAPAPILTEERLTLLKRDALVLDLASAPGGTDFEAAGRLGKRAILAPGLPGKTSPLSAARAIKDAVFELIVEESKNE